MLHLSSLQTVLLTALLPGTVQTNETALPLGREIPRQLAVQVRTAHGTRPLLAVPGIAVVVPLTGRSTTFPPADTHDGEVRLTVFAAEGAALDAVRVEVLRHAADTEVRAGWPLFEPVWMGPAHLPLSITADGAARTLLPELARSDGNCLPPGAKNLSIEFATGEVEPGRLVAIDAVRGAGSDAPIWARPTRDAALEAVVLMSLGGSARSGFQLELDGTTVDRLVLREQLDLAHLEREPGAVLRGALEQLGADGELELVLAAPEPGPPGTTTTLLVTFEGTFPDRPAERAHVADQTAEGTRAPRFAVLGPDITGFPVHFEGADEQLDIRPTMGPGTALGDYDGDGQVDLYLVQGGGRPRSAPAANRLWKNRGEGPLAARFEDATESAGVGDRGWGMGSLFFDAEGDGDLDLYVANYGADVLYQNDGDGSFTDVSESAGVGGDLWSAGICAADADFDGDLDLYVTSYLDYDESAMPAPEGLGRYRRDDPVAMLPFAFPGQRNVFLRNDSWDAAASAPAEALRFTDVTDELKVADEAGRGMQAIFWDFDRDGDPDLYVANDVSYNVLFRNDTEREGDGELRFKDVSFSTGLDDPRGGMGLSVGDTDGDGDEDLFLTNWELEANALYTNNLLSHTSQKHRVGTFRDQIVSSGLGPHGVGATSWGAELFDAENDGDLDLYVANGYTSPDYETTGICVGQVDHFFENGGSGKFVRVEDAWAAGREDLPSRSVAACDLDGDGDVDLVVTANNQRPELLENLTKSGPGHWLVVRLRGAAPNTHGIGAVVTLRAGEQSWTRELRAGTSYLAGNPPELHFGIGAVASVDAVQVQWADGTTSEHELGAVDQRIELEQPR